MKNKRNINLFWYGFKNNLIAFGGICLFSFSIVQVLMAPFQGRIHLYLGLLGIGLAVATWCYSVPRIFDYKRQSGVIIYHG